MAVAGLLPGKPLMYNALVTDPEKKHSQGSNKREDIFPFHV